MIRTPFVVRLLSKLVAGRLSSGHKGAKRMIVAHVARGSFGDRVDEWHLLLSTHEAGVTRAEHVVGAFSSLRARNGVLAAVLRAESCLGVAEGIHREYVGRPTLKAELAGMQYAEGSNPFSRPCAGATVAGMILDAQTRVALEPAWWKLPNRDTAMAEVMLTEGKRDELGIPAGITTNKILTDMI
jgi:hypothetical protein